MPVVQWANRDQVQVSQTQVIGMKGKVPTWLIHSTSDATPNSVRDILDAIKGIQALDVLSLPLGQVKPLRRLISWRSAPRLVVIHNTAIYFPAKLEELLNLLGPLRRAGRVRLVVMKQDEHLAPYEFDRLFCEYEVDTVFTCLSDHQIPTVYPKSVRHGIAFQQSETVYIGSRLGRLSPSRQGEQLELFYRGSDQPPQLGELGFDKYFAPELISSRTVEFPNWKMNLSSAWEDRVYGEQWFEAISKSRAVLGTRPGSNIFDLDGSLAERTKTFEAQFGKVEWENRKLTAAYFERVLKDYEGNITRDTISPRNVEAALLGRPQILVDGPYQGVFHHKQNALLVSRDFSELAGALSLLESPGFAAELASNSRETFLADSRFHVRTLQEKFEALL